MTNKIIPYKHSHEKDEVVIPFRRPPNEMILASGEAYFSSLLNDINNAEYSIDLEMYIFRRDIIGKKIAQALADAAERGVCVRVLVDGAGSPLWSASLARTLEKSGAKTRVFHPFPWQLWNWSRSVVKLPTLLKWTYLLLKINFRNHRKVCIIDEKIAYAGSTNISKCHLPKNRGGDDWRDISIRLTNIDLTDLNDAFDCAWTHRTIKERLREAFRHVRRDPIIRLNHIRHRRRILYKSLLRRIRQCRHRIWITNAYFVPDNFLLRKLKEAARAGVDVRILLPKKSDVMMMPWASSTFYYSLLKAGVRIYEYLPSMLHAKILILDNWASIGSSNLNHRSLLHDLEVDINLTNKSSKKILADLFLQDITQSKEVALDSWHITHPRYHRILGKLLLYMKYWI